MKYSCENIYQLTAAIHNQVKLRFNSCVSLETLNCCSLLDINQVHQSCKD